MQHDASSAPLLAFLLAGVVLVLGAFLGIRAWRLAVARNNHPGDGDEPPQLPAGS